ncbi:heavy metal-associated isoprenylated plant protein 3 [Nicotiana tabacum]|uniref:Heavy metal-associated isoprenylated plant protein 3 n=1 Tax=Nicotiana tabacum TaxID=4097 RepID=A0A1S4A3L2_TOBAC|nr:heavy metal-associated isoprenylated plant protein 6-like [Nicotiana tomentosiformis]XP_016471174.1 PREDICTED: heavy metal-associated isoprenylated plant protein 3-like [Nicotiana tabacum]
MGEKKEETKVKGAEKKNEGGEKKGDNTATIVLKLDLHCEGCAKKVRRFIRHSEGVEDVKSDCESGKLTVKGNVDPSWLRERVEIKTKKKVELISSPPKKDGGSGGAGGDKKSNDKTEKKTEDKKDEEKKPKEPQVSTVVLKIRMHCDGCAHKTKRIIKKIKGVQEVTIESEKDLVTIKGIVDIKKLIPYLTDKLKQNVEVVTPKKDDSGGEKKGKESGNDKKEKESAAAAEKKDGESKEKKTEVINKMEYYGYNSNTYYAMPMHNQSHMNQDYGLTTYDPRYAHTGYAVEYAHQPQYAPPPPPPTYLNAPQMFSDENPNGCTIM